MSIASRRIGRTLLAIGAAVALAGVGSGPAAAAAEGGSSDIPTPGPGYRLLSAYRVTTGVQIYACTAAGTWSTSSTPEAQLKRYGRPGTIHHHAGPRWTSNKDGSTVVGAVDIRVPKDGTIPWLLLHVSAHENSAPGKELNNVAFISRINTSGGVGPTGACTPGVDADQAVPYHADYLFWVPCGRRAAIEN
jgi:hypothetical protein